MPITNEVALLKRILKSKRARRPAQLPNEGSMPKICSIMTSQHRALNDISSVKGSQTRLAQPTGNTQRRRSASAQHRMHNFAEDVLHITKPKSSYGCHHGTPVRRTRPSPKHSLLRHALTHTPSAHCAFSTHCAMISSMGRRGNSHKQRHPNSP